jgi:predicted RecB family nuclease
MEHIFHVTRVNDWRAAQAGGSYRVSTRDRTLEEEGFIHCSYPDGLYLDVGYRSPTNNDWKLDIWFVDEPERQPDLAYMRWIPDKLTREARTTILLIKSAWASRPEYGKSAKSFDIYSAVLEDGVRTLEAFDEWLQR